MKHRISLCPGLAAALLAGGCGLVSPPPQRTAEALPPAAVEAPPRTPASSSSVPPKVAPALKALPKADARPAARVSTPAPKAAAAAQPRPSAPPLDLKSLEARLKETGAIGVLTKLSLKNQVDDLVERFRVFHGGQRPPTIADLRPSFDLLVMKVLSLLQDKDAALAKDIDASRNALWSVLTDREKLASHN